MKKILLTLIISLFLLSFITAMISDIGTYELNSCVEIRQTCPDCTYNNISNIIISPNSLIVLTEVPMTKQGTYYNYSFCNTTLLGTYTVNGYGDIGGTLDTWEYTFEVTKTGGKLETSEALIYLIVLMASVSLFVLCLWGAIKTVWKNPRNDENKIIDISYLKYVKISLCFLSYALLIWITNIMVLITNNLLNSSVAFTFFKVVYTILISMFYPIILGVLFVIAMNILLDKKFKRLLERGIFPDG